MKNGKLIFIFLSFLLVGTTVSLAQSAPRFVDNGDNTVTDIVSGLMWRKRTPSSLVSHAVIWREALEKCKNLNLGGYKDWRLPTLDEWNTIIDTKNQFPALVEPNPFKNVIVKSPYWSFSEYTGKNHICDAFGCPLMAHVVLLYFGNTGHQNKDKKAFVWPVRSTKKRGQYSEMASNIGLFKKKSEKR